jgi:hypothetical protein
VIDLRILDSQMSASSKRRFVRVLAVIVLLGAVLPNVAYVGHWNVAGLGAPAESEDGHANHCHGSTSCADSVFGLQWWIEGDGGPTLDTGDERAADPEGAPRPLEAAPTTLDPPPQHA